MRIRLFGVVSLLVAVTALPRAQSAKQPVAALHVARHGHTATALFDGRILIAGGMDGGVCVATQEIFDAATAAWSDSAPMPACRSAHTATRLSDGRVLMAGGIGDDGVRLMSVDVYDPFLEQWAPASPLPAPRYGHEAELLPSGRVQVCGGTTVAADGVAADGVAGDGVAAHGADVAAADCVTYDPASNTWTDAAPMLTAATAAARPGHSATVLPDGRVLVAGGFDADGGATRDAVLYDSTSDTWTPTAALAIARGAHSATLLPSGDVLIAGGAGGSDGVALNSVEIWRLPDETRTTTIRIAGASPASSKFGQAVALTARVEGDGTPEGAVEFFDNKVSLGPPVALTEGSATLQTAALSVNNSLTAVYIPARGFAASTSPVFPYVVAKAAATATLMLSKSPQQYSDLETFEATMSPVVPGQAIAGSVTFRVGTQDMGDAPLLLEGTVYKARLTTALVERVPGQMQPTTPFGRTVTAVINAPNFQVANPTRALVITKEDARATFDGTRFALTSGAGTADTAAVTLRATIRDITAVDPAQDASAGNIGGAYAQFYNRDTGAAISPALPVTLLRADDPSTGFVSYKWTPAAGSANSVTFRVGVMLGTLYLRNSSSEDALVTIAKPISPRFLTGGGLLPGGVNTYALGVKYTGTGSAPSGQFQTMVQAAGKVFHVKSGTLSSLVVSGPTATLKGTATIDDVTNGSLTVDPRATVEVKVTDNGASDLIAVTIRSGSGALWFSSAAASVAGGDLIVR